MNAFGSQVALNKLVVDLAHSLVEKRNDEIIWKIRFAAVKGLHLFNSSGNRHFNCVTQHQKTKKKTPKLFSLI